MLGNFIFGKKNLTATVGLYTENATRYTKKHVGFYNTYMCFPAFYVKHALVIWLRQKHVPYTKQAYFCNKKTPPHSFAKAFSCFYLITSCRTNGRLRHPDRAECNRSD